MANTYKFKGVALATGSETALLTAATDEILIIKSILVTNNTGNTPTLSLDVLDKNLETLEKFEEYELCAEILRLKEKIAKDVAKKTRTRRKNRSIDDLINVIKDL